MQSVTVLATNGRRHVVKVEPSRTVLWILEQTCEKHKLNVDEFDLKHHNKILDLSLMFRFAGIPNNANLEMVPIVGNKRVEQEVTICLQLEDGNRLNGQFSSSSTLRDILEKLCPEKLAVDSAPLVLIYMRSEYHGDTLNSTTLRIMGLSSGGRALLRLIHADPQSLRTQANVSANLPQKPREPSPERPMSKSSQEKKTGSLNVAEEVKKIKQVNTIDDKTIIENKIEENVKKSEIDKENKQENVREIQKMDEKMEVDVVESEPEPEAIVNLLDDRGTIIFSLDSMESSNNDVSDSFFDLTESEVRLLYRELKQQVNVFENRPFMTSEMRKLEESKKILNQLSVYKSCIVRIQFPNRYVIQTKFSTVETVDVVIEFLRKFLVDPDIDFYLFTTPPKNVLDKTQTLIESHCVPSALLHFGCDKTSNLIKDEFLQKLSSGSGAKKVLGGNQRQVKQIEEGEASGSSSSAVKPTIPTNFMASRASTTSASGNVPKWFKFAK